MAATTKSISVSLKEHRKDTVDADFRPWKNGETLPTKCRRLIYNALIKTRATLLEMQEKEVEKHVSTLLGISVATVRRVKREIKEKGRLSTPGKKRPKCADRYRRIHKYDEFALSTIRCLVHDFYRHSEIPTLNKVTARINNDDQLPNLSRTTVNRILHDLNFRFEKRKRRAMLIERDDIIAWRRKFLHELKKYRQEKRNVIYLDETWISASHSTCKASKDKAIESKCEVKHKGLGTGQKSPTVEEGQLVILHAGGESGFLPGCRRVLRSKKTGDCYGEINGPFFQRWFEESLLPNLKQQTVIVMDNASYHFVVKDQFPSRYWQKESICKWLTERNVKWEDNMVKVELLQKIEHLKPQYQECIVDFLAKKAGHVVLKLPPYHCELNPIELVWSHVKGYVAANNTTFNLHDVEVLVNKVLDDVKPEVWQNCIQLVLKIEEDMWNLDDLMDLAVERFFAEANSSTSSEEGSEDDMQCSCDDELGPTVSSTANWEEICKSIMEHDDSS